jgi:cyclopropane fatty-acyl-phospholipid synthase-like methyltransferase
MAGRNRSISLVSTRARGSTNLYVSISPVSGTLLSALSAQLARHEHYLAAQMELKPGMRVLDVGCGVGGPAREIAGFADVQIVGLNNNDFQIGRARKYTAKQGLQDQVTFVKGDFMKLSEQFGEGTFDAGTWLLQRLRCHVLTSCSVCD